MDQQDHSINELVISYNTNLNTKGGIYMLKLDVSYKNTLNLPTTTQLKVYHDFNNEVSVCNVMYFNNNTNIYTYSNTAILYLCTNDTIIHNFFLPQYLSGISNINVSIVNAQYTLSLLKIA